MTISIVYLSYKLLHIYAECDHSLPYPDLSLLLHLLAKILNTAAEAERLFLQVEQTLTAIRSLLADDRLEAIILMQIYCSDNPPPEAVIDRFTATTAMRLDFVVEQNIMRSTGKNAAQASLKKCIMITWNVFL